MFILITMFITTHFAAGQALDSIENSMVTFIEDAPYFKGDLKAFIQNELDYPQSAKNDNFEGMIVISFKIDTSGFTFDHQIKKGIREDLNNEALRVTKLITFDKPGLQHGKPIVVEYTVPVVFNPCNAKNK